MQVVPKNINGISINVFHERQNINFQTINSNFPTKSTYYKCYRKFITVKSTQHTLKQYMLPDI